MYLSISTQASHIDPPCQVYVDTDGIVKQSLKFAVSPETCIYLNVITHDGEITDAQCQAVLSYALWVQLHYKMASENIKCKGITWEELLRRG